MTFVDLSQPIYEGTPVYPGDPLFESRPFAEHETDGFRGSRFTIGSHLGTHLDFPRHFFVDGESLDSFSVDFFSGFCACLDLAALVGPESERYRRRVDGTRPVAATVDDFAPFEEILETVPIVALRVGWSRALGRPEYYDDFPSLSPELCDWLADYPNLRILALETPSLVASPLGSRGDESRPPAANSKPRFDPELNEFLPEIRTSVARDPQPGVDASAPSRPFDELELMADAECHRILLGRRPPILILEGLVNLERCPRYERPADGSRVARDPRREFELSCYPLPIRGADGSPTRAVARFE